MSEKEEWYQTVVRWSIVLIAALLVMQMAVSCELTRDLLGTAEHPGPVPAVVRDVGESLPPPWDLVVTGLGGVLAGIGTMIARQKHKERKLGGRRSK